MTCNDKADAAEEVGFVFLYGNRLAVEDGIVAGGTGQLDNCEEHNLWLIVVTSIVFQHFQVSVIDIENLSLKEMPVYVVIAAVLSMLVLSLTMESWLVPVLFLLSIGVAILYNLGTNFFLGEISYLTKALTAVLQLGVTMDYSIFLLNSYEENKERFPGEEERAMAHAISNTFKSITGSSLISLRNIIKRGF